MQHQISPRTAARQAITDLAEAARPGAVGQSFLHAAPTTLEPTGDHPGALVVLRAAVQLSEALRRETTAAVLDARSRGESWVSIAEVLEMRVDGEPDAEAAYLRTLGLRGAAGELPLAVLWTCTTCSGVVRDLGPVLTDPSHRESGHTGDCARLVREIIAWRSEAEL